MEINGLLKSLQSFGVEQFKGYGIEVTFKRTPWTASSETITQTVPGTTFQGATDPTTQTAVGLTDPGLAQSLDGEMDYDKLLNWSASPSMDLPTPLAGDDQPLTNTGGT